MALEITDSNFEELAAQGKPIVLDFWATWCGPCRMIAPIVEQIAEENEDIKVCKVDVDDQPELTSSFGIQSIPTLIVFKNGEIANKAVGARSKEAILEMLK